MKKNGIPLAIEEGMVSYKQFRLVRSAFLGYKNVNSDSSGPERGGRVMLAATESEKAVAER